ncbi:MAG TPA: DUF1223 domain-containing protein [Aridibacter sp.]|nr:DUF1223 domain-containing protein [Aridibacter sp.]
MKKFAVFLILALASACSAQQRAAASGPGTAPDKAPASAKQPVLVELFTSEGCASCPPAEKNLAYLQTEQPYAGVEIITLAFHVDYWNGLGWRDPFASPLFTQRQRIYDRKFRTGNIYTPQMVVDGDIEFIGSKLEKAEKAISRSIRNEKGDIDIDVRDGKISIKITRLPESDYASVYLAYAEDGLSSDVKRGENAGKTLSHVSVVRALNGVGRIEPGQTAFELVTALNIDRSWDRERLKVVVFVQENHTRKIFAAASAPF